MAEGEVPDQEPTLVERWLQDQQQWQQTLFTYLDSMMKNDEFLMHMGNAMRGSLLAGKPYPTSAPPSASEATPAPENAVTTDRLDKVLFALHQLQGQVNDVLMTLDEMRGARKAAIRLKPPASARSASARPRQSLGEGGDSTRASKTKKAGRATHAKGARKTGKRRGR